MKTNLLTLGLVMLTFIGLSQQQIGNSGFENWDNVGTGDEEPTNWNSFMTASGSYAWAAGQQVEQSTDAHSGTYSCRIFSTSSFGIIANGNVTVGQVNMGSTTPSNSSNHNITRTGNPDFHQVLTDEPDSLVFWVKFTPIDGNDLGRVSATVHDNYEYRDPENAASTAEIVAKAELNFPTTSNQWERISVPFDYATYTSNNKNAEFILITFTTNENPGGGTANDEMLVDDVELIYNIPQVDITPTAAQTILVNDPGNDLTANESPVSATSREWKYTTTSGSGYQSFAPVETGATYTPQFANTGTYYVIVESIISGNTVVSNEVEINVIDQPEVTITPGANQSILVNENGNELTANESPAGTSREWKFSTTSGSGYQSFGTAETGMTYTPNFAAVGTYYVVVESDINAATYTSNEVMVDVSEPVSTSNHPSLNNIKVYAYEQNIVIDLNDANISSGDFVLYNSTGQEVLNQSLNNQQTKLKVTLSEGVYFYQIIDGAQAAHGKIYLAH